MGKLRVLYFRDLPIADPNEESTDPIDWYYLAHKLHEWAGDDMERFSMGFLLVAEPETDSDNYLLQIGRVDNEGAIVTDKNLLEHTATLLNGVMEFPENVMADARFHIEKYYQKLGEWCPWGEQEFYYLRDKQNKTERILEGPHKGLKLRPGQKRYVIKKDDGELAVGSIIS